MASADLREELECSICLSIYTDPVTLRCGHNFCRDCIDQHFNAQNRSRGYSCPECRTVFRKRPALKKNITLCNVTDRVLSTEPPQEKNPVMYCTYCTHSPVPSVRSCLSCLAFLCKDHLRLHSKGPDHFLTDPRTSLGNRKCSVHKKILEYYCTEDLDYICVSCRLDGEHQGHQVETLDEASEKKKKKLRNVLQKLITKRKETEERVQSLEEQRRKTQEKASAEAIRVTALFIDIRKWLDDLENSILCQISSYEYMAASSLSDVIQRLEIKKNDLSRKMKDIEELCNMTDPLTVLQEPDTGDLCDLEEWRRDEDTGRHKKYDIDMDLITWRIHYGISDIKRNLEIIIPLKPEEMLSQPPSLLSQTQDLLASGTEYSSDVRAGDVGDMVMAAGDGGIYGEGLADISLDVNTAHNNIFISNDLKTVHSTYIHQKRPETAERFQDYPQVMSSRGFTSGQHYWDVEVGGTVDCVVGMCYPSITRKGLRSQCGFNNKSWGLFVKPKQNSNYFLMHKFDRTLIPHESSSNRFQICLDYEAGELSFYELCDPIRHLHTFTATFTEPLHAMLYVWEGSIKILGGGEATDVRIHHKHK